MKKNHIKAMLSGLLLLAFLVLAISGAMLYFGKTGVILGLPRGSLRDAHALTALIMCVLVLAHLFLNRRVFSSELKSLIERIRNIH